jgi:hypothetical protein
MKSEAPWLESALDSRFVAFPFGKPVSTFPGNAPAIRFQSIGFLDTTLWRESPPPQQRRRRGTDVDAIRHQSHGVPARPIWQAPCNSKPSEEVNFEINVRCLRRLSRPHGVMLLSVRCASRGFPRRRNPARSGDPRSAGTSVSLRHHLIRKSSFLSLVPFISSRIQIGVMPRPDHFTDLSFLD